MFTVKSFLLLCVCKGLLLKLSIAHHHRLQGAKVIQLALSTIIPILRENQLWIEKNSQIPSYLKPIRNIEKQYE